MSRDATGYLKDVDEMCEQAWVTIEAMAEDIANEHGVDKVDVMAEIVSGLDDRMEEVA